VTSVTLLGPLAHRGDLGEAQVGLDERPQRIDVLDRACVEERPVEALSYEEDRRDGPMAGAQVGSGAVCRPRLSP
jgi:hypothetical protein